MAEHFFDTSAAVKHYRSEAGTAKVDALLAMAGAQHFLSVMTVVEVHSVLARLVRMGQITVANLQLVRDRFLADIAAGLWQLVHVADSDFQRAQQLLVQYGTTHGLRTLDALQLATALEWHVSHPLDAFVCADGDLCQVAVAEGLTVVNPEIP